MAPITLNDVRFSYCSLFQPVSRQGGDPKYSTTVLVPKPNVAAKAAIDQAIQEAIQAGTAKSWGGVRPPRPAICVHDGDGGRPSDGQPFGEECRGCWVFTASSKEPPFLVDAQMQRIIDPREVYSGMWGNVSVSFFPYNSNGKKGVGCYLNGVQKVRDDEALGGHRVTAEQAFHVVTDTTAPTYSTPAAPPAYATPGYSAQAPQNAFPYQVDPITGQPVPF